MCRVCQHGELVEQERPAGLFAPKVKETLEEARNQVFLLLLKLWRDIR